jgi:hypothetical protein
VEEGIKAFGRRFFGTYLKGFTYEVEKVFGLSINSSTPIHGRFIFHIKDLKIN